MNRTSIYPPQSDLIAYYNELYSIDDEVQSFVREKENLEIKYGREYYSLLEQAQGNRVLDIGCGTGESLTFLAERFNSVYGTEISEEALKAAALNNKSAHLELVDGVKLPFPENYFDLIVSNQVVEHIYPHENRLFFAEIARVLQPGGRAILSTPNGDEIRRKVLWMPIRILSVLLDKPEIYLGAKLYAFQNFISEGTRKAALFRKYELLEHLNVLTSKRLKGYIKNSGLLLVDIRYDGLRVIFPRLFMKLGMKTMLQNFERKLARSRKLFLSNMTIILEKPAN